MRLLITTVALCATAGVAVRASAQQVNLTRAQAVQTALNRGARVAVAAADTALAAAQIVAARVFPDPSFTASYSKAVPTQHYSFDVPLEFPGLRGPRAQSAQVALAAARVRFHLARATVALDADTTYTRAVATREHLALSRRNALDSDSLLHMVDRRRAAGDASDMDVELARVNAGQQENTAAADSLTWISTLLDLQATLGYTSVSLEINAVDSLETPPEARVPAQTTLSEDAASLSLTSATLNVRAQRHSVFAAPTISFGFEHGDPSQPGLLPTFGLGLSLPIFNRRRGEILVAEAEQTKAQAELVLAQVEVRNEIAHAIRERENALAKVARDRQLIASADRVASYSLVAYREGAASLPNVLEAQRSAREVRGQYIDDLAAAWIATAELRVLSLTPTTQLP
jgi:cobalt-zinc-cadmium efflux system outer membrane protein